MKNNLVLFGIIFLITHFSVAQNFGDSYSSVKSQVTNISSTIPNSSITCEFNIPGIDGLRIYNFDENEKLFSQVTLQYLPDSAGEELYYGIYKKYNDMFGAASIDNKKENCSDCPKLKSKWTKSNESLILTYFSLSGESLVQTLYIKRKGTY